MSDPLSEADIRRARLHCNLAALVFLICGAGVLLLPAQMATAVRAVVAGFNLIVALAVFLCGGQLKIESCPSRFSRPPFPLPFLAISTSFAVLG